MPSEARLKFFLKICKEKHSFCINKYSQKYFPCVSKTFSVLQQNSLCFPCLEKVRTKFPVFPVPWPPCNSAKYSCGKLCLLYLGFAQCATCQSTVLHSHQLGGTSSLCRASACNGLQSPTKRDPTEIQASH